MCSLERDWITTKGPVHLLCRAGESASINYSADTDGDLNGGAAGCRFFFPDTSCLVGGLAEARGVPPWSRAWLVVLLRGGSEQAANPCRGSGVWQQWLRQLEINFPAVIALCCFVHLSMAGTAVKGFRVETAPANNANTKLDPNSCCTPDWLRSVFLSDPQLLHL